VSDSLEQRRKRLTFRAWHRGMKELDLLIGGFADRHLAELSPAQLDRFEALLDVPEPLMYRWLMGHERPPAAFDHDVTHLLLNFRYSPQPLD
jgi:antitoxin CptB